MTASIPVSLLPEEGQITTISAVAHSFRKSCQSAMAKFMGASFASAARCSKNEQMALAIRTSISHEFGIVDFMSGWMWGSKVMRASHLCS